MINLKYIFDSLRIVETVILKFMNVKKKCKNYSSWEKNGVSVQTVSAELDMKGVLNLLNESNSIVPVEGLYVTVGKTLGHKEIDQCLKLLTNLDLASRKLCPSLR